VGTEEEARARFEARLRRLTELEGDALLVPEPPALGGFGYEIDGALYNADTLRFFEVLIALERGAVLDEIRTPGRKVVWEIGAGSGGLAYQFKTLFPEVTYVIVDRPERLEISAKYLTTVFPEAKEGIDFVFAATGASEALRSLPPDLAINPDGHARLAWELGCPFVYTVNDDAAREAAGRYYWTHEVPLLELNRAPLPERLRSMLAPDPSRGCRHVVGWRRAST
jgi:hypothetical protein